MELEIHVTNKRHNPDVEEFTRSRLELVVGRFHDRLSRIDVKIRDDNAHKGGIDKTCSIDAHLTPRGSLHVHATEADVHEAILKAIHRLDSVIAKTLDRGHLAKTIRHQHGGVKHESQRIADQLATGEDGLKP